MKQIEFDIDQIFPQRATTTSNASNVTITPEQRQHFAQVILLLLTSSSSSSSSSTTKQEKDEEKEEKDEEKQFFKYNSEICTVLSPLFYAIIQSPEYSSNDIIDFRTELYNCSVDWLKTCAPFTLVVSEQQQKQQQKQQQTEVKNQKIQFSCLCKLFRFILQYHDPELSVHFDKNRFLPDQYILPWINTVFLKLLLSSLSSSSSSSSSSLNVGEIMSLGIQLWTLLMSHWHNPLFVCFFGLSLLTVNRSKLLTELSDVTVEKQRQKKQQQEDEEEKQQRKSLSIEQILSSYFVDEETSGRTSSDFVTQRLRQLYEQAILLDAQTPHSAKYQLFSIMHPTNMSNIELFDQVLAQNVVLPVPTRDVVEVFKKKKSSSSGRRSGNSSSADSTTGNNNNNDNSRQSAFKYIVIDCRSKKSFRFARLPTAVHIGEHVGYDKQKMQAILDRFDAARGSHFTIFGTGRGLADEENLLKVIAMRFIAQNFEHISVTLGGFKETIKYISKDEIEFVRDEVPTPAHSSTDASGSAHSTAEEVKEQIASKVQNLLSWGKQVATEYMESAEKANHEESTSTKLSHSSSKPAFTFDDDDDEFEDAYENWQQVEQVPKPDRVIKLEDLKKIDPNVALFSVEVDGTTRVSENEPREKRYLAIGSNFILSLKPHPLLLGCGIILWERTLRQLVKITYHKQTPNRLTFDLKSADATDDSISIRDVYIIPQHSECIKKLQQNIAALKSVRI